MKISEIIREAWRNVLCGASRATIVTIGLGTIALIFLTFDALTIRGLITEGQRYQQSGAAIKTIISTGAIDGVLCDEVHTIQGVQAAGAIRNAPDTLKPLALPGSSIPAYEVTPSIVSILTKTWQPGGILVSRTVATRFGVSVGDSLPISGGIAKIGGIFDWNDDGRRAGFGYAALIPTYKAGFFNECWAVAWPESDQLPVILRSTVVSELVGDSSPPIAGAINQRLGVRFLGSQRFNERITQFAPLTAFICTSSIMWFITRGRRLELAANEHFGVGHNEVVAITLVETWISLMPILMVLAVLTLFLAQPLSVDSAGIIAGCLKVLASTVAGALLGTFIAASVTRSRHLFRYLKFR